MTEEQESGSEEEQENGQNSSDKCMQISLKAMEVDSVNAMSVLVSTEGKQAMALVDYGSNSTFMNLSFALKTSCTIIKDKSRPVAVAGGGKLWSGAYIPDTPFPVAKRKVPAYFQNSGFAWA